MAKAIHMMVRVLDEARSVDFYDRAFGLEDRRPLRLRRLHAGLSAQPGERLRGRAHGQQGRAREPYQHGDGYGHVAFAVGDLDAEHRRFQEQGLQPADIKEFHRDGALMARFFFVQDPDGYKIEVLQRHGRYR